MRGWGQQSAGMDGDGDRNFLSVRGRMGMGINVAGTDGDGDMPIITVQLSNVYANAYCTVTCQ